MATQERKHHIDILNCLACFAVVVLHSSGDVFVFSPTPHWYGNMFFQTIAHWAVPVFFMLTGATLLGYRARYTTKEFFKKRARRILIPFLIWSCIYIVWNVIKGTYPFPSFTAIVGMLLNNDVQNIFWFFYALIPIYLCIPVISLVAKKENVKTLCYW
ncbi:MAG: acyltransferase, partial [Actinobacteria bacterium]|nr:acyltransferase [Actinomycetota bacterium]